MITTRDVVIFALCVVWGYTMNTVRLKWWPEIQRARRIAKLYLTGYKQCLKRDGHLLCSCGVHCCDCNALAPTSSRPEWRELPTIPEPVRSYALRRLREKYGVIPNMAVEVSDQGYGEENDDALQ